MAAMNRNTFPAASALLADPAEGTSFDDRTIRWLLSHGVRIEDITTPIAIRASRVTFQPDGRYRKCPGTGDFALILPVPADPVTMITDLGVLDLIAWSPKSGRIATRLGIAFALGEEQIDVDGLGNSVLPIPVHRDPLDWLRAGRRGLVISDWNLATLALRDLVLEAEDAAHDQELVRRLTPVPPTILIVDRRLSA